MSERSPGAPGQLGANPPVEVRRSAKRRRTVSADLRDGVVVVSIPAHFTAAQEREWVHRMVAKLQSKYQEAARPANGPGDAGPGDGLLQRAAALSQDYLAGRGQPVSIGWVTNQNSRWASATPSRKTIRLSHKLQGMPDWVVNYVILHELAHLIEPSHNRTFWRLLESYPQTESAKSFLDGVAFAANHGLAGRES
ncbi:YgjP-like metallopeptidase domain-containing protein [Arthrobacter sp. HLT1-21]